MEARIMKNLELIVPAGRDELKPEAAAIAAELQALGEKPVPASLRKRFIRFRKEHLGRYLAALVTKPYDGKMVQYLDMVGKIHTPKAGSKELDVPLVQMNALMGFVADALTATILGLGLDRATEVRTLRAFCKLLWVQNDLIVRHYAK